MAMDPLYTDAVQEIEQLKQERDVNREALSIAITCLQELYSAAGVGDVNEAFQQAAALSALKQSQLSQHLSFCLLRGANNARQAEWPGTKHTDTTFKALEVCGEAGELAEAVKKLMRAERGIAGTKANLGNVADELADVVISADLLAAHLKINLASAVASKFNKTSEKYGLLTRIAEGHQ